MQKNKMMEKRGNRLYVPKRVCIKTTTLRTKTRHHTVLFTEKLNNNYIDEKNEKIALS